MTSFLKAEGGQQQSNNKLTERMFSPKRVKQDIIRCHLEPRLFFLLLLALRYQVLNQQRGLSLHAGGAVGLSRLLVQKLLLHGLLLTVLLAHPGTGRSSSRTPVRHIAKLNVGVKNSHAGVYITEGHS